MVNLDDVASYDVYQKNLKQIWLLVNTHSEEYRAYVWRDQIGLFTKIWLCCILQLLYSPDVSGRRQVLT